MNKPSTMQAILYASTSDSFFTEYTASDAGNAIPDISVYPKKCKQLIEGFGGCFNEKGWEALSVLNTEERHQVMQRMFHPKEGLGFTICRVPIGTNDYSIDRYSLNETPGDFEMKHFSIERDKMRIIPYIKEAMSIQPKLRLWGSAWTPPTWMKDNKNFDSGNFLDHPEIYRAYALYLLKFIRAYRQEGIPVEAVAVQNEPGTLTNYPSCDWTPIQYLTFIRDYLGPLFEKEKIDDAIMLGTFNQPKLLSHALTVLLDPRARRYVSVAGIQWFGIQLIEQIYTNAPGLPIWQTETDCGNWFWLPKYDSEKPQNDIFYAGFTWEKIRDYLKKGASVYELWNMVLKPDGKSIDSKNPWPQNSLITVDPETRYVRYTPLFGAIGCFSKYVTPGSHLVEAEGVAADADFISFIDPDENVIVVLYNRKESAVSLNVEVRRTVYTVTLPPQSFSTLVVPKK